MAGMGGGEKRETQVYATRSGLTKRINGGKHAGLSLARAAAK
jgi:hypothetical protein